MRFQGTLRNAGLALALCATAAFHTGCSEDTTEPDKSGTFYGPSEDVGNGTAKAYVTLDKDGNPTEVGLRVTEAAMEGLGDEVTTSMMHFPDQASGTVFEHVMLDWNPQGHEPLIFFGKPHFDVHFYTLDDDEIAEIDPSRSDFPTRAANLPESKYIPADYVTPPGEPAANTVPMMGLHWTDSTDGLIPGEYDFTSIFIYGSWDGDMIFMEPMMTREWLMTKPTLQQNVKLPQAYQKTGYWPTTYSVRFDDSAKEYVITLGGMTMRTAS